VGGELWLAAQTDRGRGIELRSVAGSDGGRCARERLRSDKIDRRWVGERNSNGKDRARSLVSSDATRDSFMSIRLSRATYNEDQMFDPRDTEHAGEIATDVAGHSICGAR
jgi:hypothetical protein